jgi:hypothetical protein
MPHRLPLALVLSGAALALVGCDSGDAPPPCGDLAAHVADVLAKDKPELLASAKDKAVADLKAACEADPPTSEEIECAMKAETRAALDNCDPKDPVEEEKKKEEAK